MTLIMGIPAVIGTAGHVDHGKTSLVRALTGIDTDTLKEEKLRGVSINLGFAHMDFFDNGAAKRIALVDVPGHEKFIKNMLAGTTGIDMALFAVAADDGIMPQTLEHFDIIRFLGVKNAVFALTKCDLVSEERIAEVSSDIAALLNNTILAGSPIVPVSSVTGKGMAELRKALLERLARRTADESGFFRMAVDRAFSLRGFGTVVTGTVASGTIKKGAEAVIFPAGERVKVRGLQSLHLEAQSVSASRRAALNINCAGDKVMRGDVITEPELFELAGSGAFFADCRFEFSAGWAKKFALLRKPKLLKVYHQAAEVDAMLRIAECHAAYADGKAFGRLTLKKPLLMLRLDRFILRDAPTNSTIGGGVVLAPFFSAKKRRAPRLTGGASMPDETAGFARILDYALPDLSLGFETRDAMLLLNARPVVFNGFFDDKKNAILGEYALSGGFAVNLTRMALARKLLLKSLGDFHDANKTQPAMKEDALLKAVNLKPKHVLKSILDALVNERVVRREADGVAMPSHNLSLGKIDAEIEQAVMRLFPSTGVSAVLADDIYKLAFKLVDVKKALARLQSSGVIVRLTQDCFISGKAYNAAKAKLVEFLTSHASIKAAEFRDALGCGRKLAIEVLEYFDREKVTLRLGDARTLRG